MWSSLRLTLLAAPAAGAGGTDAKQAATLVPGHTRLFHRMISQRELPLDAFVQVRIDENSLSGKAIPLQNGVRTSKREGGSER